MSRVTRYTALINSYGFLPGEARQLSHTSKRGMQAPYFQRMLSARRALFLNAKRYKWNQQQYRTVIKQQYIDRGCLKQDVLGRIKADVWQMLRWYEERTPLPDDYESPWRKKIEKRSSQKRETKRITRRSMLQSWINQIDRRLVNPSTSEGMKSKLTQQRNNLQKQLDNLK